MSTGKWRKPNNLRVASKGEMRHRSRTMKGKGLIIFAVFAVLAGAGSAVFLSQIIKEKETVITEKEEKIKGLETEKATLETAKADLTKELDKANTTLISTKTELSNLTAEHYKKIAEHARFTEKIADELAAKDEKISALNGELQKAQNKNRDYDSQIKDLNSQMATKDQAIEDISRRLESTTEDRDHLLRERDKLIAEKAELEKQFQDIVVLRQKVQQLQVELMASKKLEWLRRGFYGGARQKGGARLMGMNRKQKRPTDASSADLNVEVRRDGTVKIVPIETNTPPNEATP